MDIRRPYQNSAITTVIGVYFFSTSSEIVSLNLKGFIPVEEGCTDNELPDAMIAAASTVVRRVEPFSSSSFTFYASIGLCWNCRMADWASAKARLFC